MKKLLVALLALVSLAVVAAGCGGGDKKADNGADKKVTLKVGATAVPHAEILNQIKGTLAKEGVDLQIIEFSDYVKPNLALNDKELDANFFQHEPYLDTFVSERKMNLVSASKVHIEPMGIYSKKIKSLNDIPEGAKIAKESPYANIVAVRKGDENRPEIQKLMNALRSPEVKKFIDEKYKGAVVAAF